jgi:hypothetical protein
MTPGSNHDIAEKLEELALRCEAATGPDRELDTDIFEAVDVLADWCKGPNGWAAYLPVRPTDPKSLQSLRDYVTAHAPKYTASLDTAMSLVEAEASWGVLAFLGQGYKAFIDITVSPAATPALALTAAALRARALQSKDTRDV